MLQNALFALAVGIALGMKPDDIVTALAGATTTGMRLQTQMLTNLGVEIINDAYNANPTSMEAALHVLAACRCAGRRVAVLGEMRELGELAPGAHEAVLRKARELEIDAIFTLGGLWPGGEAGMDVLTQKVEEYLRPGDVVLVKGSRGVAMERVVQALARADASLEEPKSC
jgi:UDP-N-acetylmuramoyl-tripeptide--D-alanyl-D-alanine ligase